MLKSPRDKMIRNSPKQKKALGKMVDAKFNKAHSELQITVELNEKGREKIMHPDAYVTAEIKIKTDKNAKPRK